MALLGKKAVFVECIIVIINKLQEQKRRHWMIETACEHTLEMYYKVIGPSSRLLCWVFVF